MSFPKDPKALLDELDHGLQLHDIGHSIWYQDWRTRMTKALNELSPTSHGIAAPTGTERPGEHWNARLIREATDNNRKAMLPSTTVDTHAEASVSDKGVWYPHANLHVTWSQVDALLMVANEEIEIWRTGDRMWPGIRRAVYQLVDLGLVGGPPDGGSFYQLTDAAEPFLAKARELELVEVAPRMATGAVPAGRAFLLEPGETLVSLTRPAVSDIKRAVLVAVADRFAALHQATGPFASIIDVEAWLRTEATR